MCLFKTQNKKVIICTYWCWLSVTAERKNKQDKRSEAVHSEQCVGNKKKQMYSKYQYGQVSGEGQGQLVGL